MTPDVAAEATQTLTTGLLTAVITLMDGSKFRHNCDQIFPSSEGDLMLLNGLGILICSVARNQWITLHVEQPSTLLAHNAIALQVN